MKYDHSFGIQEPKEEPAPLLKEKKGCGSLPLWYITPNELDSLSSYMRGTLTLDKINAAINDMAVYADANSQLIIAPRKKFSPLSTLESSFDNLNLKKLDVAFTVDPLYHKTSAQFDEGGEKGLLLNNLRVYGGCKVLFDSLEEQAITRVHSCFYTAFTCH